MEAASFSTSFPPGRREKSTTVVAKIDERRCMKFS